MSKPPLETQVIAALVYQSSEDAVPINLFLGLDGRLYYPRNDEEWDDPFNASINRECGYSGGIVESALLHSKHKWFGGIEDCGKFYSGVDKEVKND